MTAVRHFRGTLPHQLLTRRLGGSVSVVERRDVDGSGRFFVVIYRSGGGRWESGRVHDVDHANSAGIVLSEFLGCDFMDVRQ